MANQPIALPKNGNHTEVGRPEVTRGVWYLSAPRAGGSSAPWLLGSAHGSQRADGSKVKISGPALRDSDSRPIHRPKASH